MAVPRISFSDDRQRHRGISHHSLTVLGRIAKTTSLLPLPELEGPKLEYITGQLWSTVLKKHIIVFNRGRKSCKPWRIMASKPPPWVGTPRRTGILGAGASVMALRGLLL